MAKISHADARTVSPKMPSVASCSPPKTTPAATTEMAASSRIAITIMTDLLRPRRPYHGPVQ
jgi:hypothetical protein